MFDLRHAFEITSTEVDTLMVCGFKPTICLTSKPRPSCGLPGRFRQETVACAGSSEQVDSSSDTQTQLNNVYNFDILFGVCSKLE